MDFSNNELLMRRRAYSFAMIVLFTAYTLIGAVILPLYISTSSNVFYDGTTVPALLDYFRMIVEIVALSVVYALAIFGTFGYTLAGFRRLIWAFWGASLYKYTLNMGVDWIMNGSVPSTWVWDAVNVIFFAALEMIQFLIVLAIVVRIASRRREKKKRISARL